MAESNAAWVCYSSTSAVAMHVSVFPIPIVFIETSHSTSESCLQLLQLCSLNRTNSYQSCLTLSQSLNRGTSTLLLVYVAIIVIVVGEVVALGVFLRSLQPWWKSKCFAQVGFNIFRAALFCQICIQLFEAFRLHLYLCQGSKDPSCATMLL